MRIFNLFQIWVWVLYTVVRPEVFAQAGATFRGQVVNLANGFPVENALVVLDLPPGDGKAEYETPTDLFGFFTLTNVVPATYKVTVENRAYVPISTNLTFVAGTETNRIFKLPPIDAKVVFDIFFNVWCLATQAELSGSSIRMEYWAPGSNLSGGPDQIFNLKTGVGGVVTAANMEDGFYRFNITRAGWKPLTYSPPPDAGLVVVGDKVRLIRTHIAAAFLEPIRTELKITVKGYDPVKDKADLPLKGIVLKLTGVGLDDPTQVLAPAVSALSREDGTYTFKNLPPIQWKVSAGKLGYEGQNILVTPNGAGQLPPQEINMVLEPTKVKVTLASIYQTNSAVSGAQVELEGVFNANTEGISRKAKTEANAGGNTASALFEKLLPGRYYLRVKHQATIGGLPSRSGILFGPSAFTVNYFPKEGSAEVDEGQTEEVALDLEAIPARIQGRLFATDELGNVDSAYFDPEPSRIFHRIAHDGIVFKEHEVIKMLNSSSNLFQVDSDKSGTYTLLVPPGIFGVQIPTMQNYSGHNIEFGDLSARNGTQRGPWPYPNRWPYGTFEGGHHGAGLRLDSGHEYQLDLFMHAHYINIAGFVQTSSEPFGDVMLSIDPEGLNHQSIRYNHLKHTRAHVVASGPVSTNSEILNANAYVLKGLKPGSYTVTLDSAEYNTPPVQVTIAPWQPPGILPALAPLSPGYYFPGITHFENAFSLKPDWKAKGKIRVKEHDWIGGDDPHYTDGSELMPGFFRMTGLPNRLFRYNPIGGGIPNTSYTVWNAFFGEGWFTASGTGEMIFDAFLGGPTPNVLPSKAPTLGAYTLDLHAYSAADRAIEILGTVVQFPKTNQLAGGEVPHQGSPAPTGAIREGWFYVSSEVDLVNPDTRLVRVNVLLRRAMVVSGVVTNAHGAVPNASVVARNRYGFPVASAVTDATGNFKFPNLEPQSIYLDVSRRGYIPFRHRYEPPSIANPDITQVIALTEVPAPTIDKFTMNRFGLYLPGVLKAAGDNPISPEAARAKLTVSWKAEARGTNFDYTLDGFVRPDESQGPPEEFSVVDRVSEVWIVDRRAFTEPFVKELAQESKMPADPPSVTNYVNVMNWLAEVNAGVKGGQPYHVVHQLAPNRVRGTLNQFKGEFHLWELPSGVFSPRIVAITENGGVAIVDYQMPTSGSNAKYVPLQGMNMPAWMSGLTEFIAVGKTIGTVGKQDEKLHEKYGEGFMKIDPALNFTASIILNPLDSNPDQDSNINYKYAIGIELALGADTSEGGPLAVGPRFLGTKLRGVGLEFEVVGGDQEAALGLTGDGPEKELPLEKLSRFIPAIARSLPVGLADDGECPDVLVCIIPPKFKVSAKIGASEKLDADWLGNNVVSAYSFILEGLGVFEDFGVRVKLDPVLQKLPYVGPLLTALEKIKIRIGADGVFRSSLGAKITYKHITNLPKVTGGTVSRGDQGQRWDFLGQPSGDPVKTQASAAPSQNSLEFNIIVKVAAGLRLVAKVGTSKDGPKLEGTGLLQLGAPKQSNNPEGMYFQVDPTLGSPLIQKVSGAFSFVGEVTANLWVISYSKSWQLDIGRWDKDFTTATPTAQNLHAAAVPGTKPYMELTPVYITTTIFNPATAPPFKFIGQTGTLVQDAFRKAAFSVSAGDKPLFAFTAGDPNTGLSRLLVSTRQGDQWNAPVPITAAGGIVSVKIVEDPLGGWIAVWSEIAAADITNPYASSTLKYSLSVNGTQWSPPAVLLASTETMFGLDLTAAGDQVLLTFLSTPEGPLGEKQTLRSAFWDGFGWSAPTALLPAQHIAGTELAGEFGGSALLAVATGASELLVFEWSGTAWGAPRKLSGTVEGTVAISFGADDNGAIAWQGPDGAVLLASRPRGSLNWREPVVVLSDTSVAELQLSPITVGTQSAYVLAWTSGANVNSIYYAIVNSAGQLLLAPAQVTPGSKGVYQKLQARPHGGFNTALVAQYTSGTNSLIVERIVGMPSAADCNGNGIPDAVEIANGSVADCNGNGLPDACEIASGLALDRNGNGIPDSCEAPVADDCNRNGISDAVEIALGFGDLNGNGLLDDCEAGVRIQTVALGTAVRKHFYRAPNLRVKAARPDALDLEFEGTLEQSDTVTGPWAPVR